MPFMEGGNLEDAIHSSTDPERPLLWEKRVCILRDILSGLAYLHKRTSTKEVIVHCDIKTENILLDNNGCARLSDFGISRLMPHHAVTSTVVRGTPFYLDPTYAESGLLSTATDLYSTGVVIFQLLSGYTLETLFQEFTRARQRGSNFISELHQGDRNFFSTLVDASAGFPARMVVFLTKAIQQCIDPVPHNRCSADWILGGLVEVQEHIQESLAQVSTERHLSVMTNSSAVTQGAAATEAAQNLDVSTPQVCLVCYSEPRETRLLPCRHSSTCMRCTLRLLEEHFPKCPVGRCTFTEYITLESSDNRATFDVGQPEGEASLSQQMENQQRRLQYEERRRREEEQRDEEQRRRGMEERQRREEEERLQREEEERLRREEEERQPRNNQEERRQYQDRAFADLEDHIGSAPPNSEQRSVLAKMRNAFRSSLCSLSLGKHPSDQVPMDVLAKLLSVNTSLTTVELHGMDIEPDGAKTLASAFVENEHGIFNGSLKNLNLGDNRIGPEGTVELMVALTSNTSLNTLNLYYNNIGPVGANAVAAAIGSNNSLRILNLLRNHLGDDSRTAILAALEGSDTLTSVCGILPNTFSHSLNNQRLEKEDAMLLAGELVHNRSLNKLDLTRNRIGPEGAKALAAALKPNEQRAFNESLHTLNLAINLIGPQGTKELAAALNGSLTTLDLSGASQASGKGPASSTGS
ncbi:hypothetical protein CYMTET_30535 [Cymbomonas tetramitiformis]|uniref:Uncharacterized protein n=1 Tax=Cymbomonas tetramitiformis TaxID=36881 RepID=A0AAE0KTU3_9CHLO|nr:hypothetical protein CYMTET_30535 [Cymbomonas tetramitiformis]